MVAIVVLVETYIDSRSQVFGTVFANEWRNVGRSIPREAKGLRVLCFGTSLTRMGVVGTILEQRLGKPAYNFATSGGQPFSTYAAFRAALAAGAEPDAIVVDFTWAALTTSYDWNERVLPELSTLAECAELAIAARDLSFLARLALVWGMPSFRCREQVRANIQAAVAGAEPPRVPDMRYYARNARINRGATLAAPTGQVAPIRFHDLSIFPPAWECTPLSEHYIHEILALAESRGITVFWLVPPVEPRVQARRDALGLEGRYTQFIERVVARHRGVVVVDGRGSRYGAEAFVDMTHVNRDGAVVLTHALAEIIKGRLGQVGVAASSWVRLPDYRPDSLAWRFEDVAGSIRFIDALKARGLLR
jgi:hypothetical protein